MRTFLSPRAKALKPVVLLCIFLSFRSFAFAPRDTDNMQHTMGWVVSGGESSLLTLRPELDAWTLTNYKLTEVQWPNVYAAGDLLFYRVDLGADVNLGSAFQYIAVNAGFRVTGDKSPLSSWVEFEYGDMYGDFDNIRPLNYHPTAAQTGQRLILDYDQDYFGLTSKNYLNFLHFNLGSEDDGDGGAAAFNFGFFFSVFYLPGQQYWKYGYNDKSGNFQSVNIYNVPTLNRWEITGGIFISLIGRRLL